VGLEQDPEAGDGDLLQPTHVDHARSITHLIKEPLSAFSFSRVEPAGHDHDTFVAEVDV
jgi:hypothetical protein